MFAPASATNNFSLHNKDLLVTTGDYMRIWSVQSSEDDANTETSTFKTLKGSSSTVTSSSKSNSKADESTKKIGAGSSLPLNVKVAGVFSNNKHAEYCAPLTSFDWNEVVLIFKLFHCY